MVQKGALTVSVGDPHKYAGLRRLVGGARYRVDMVRVLLIAHGQLSVRDDEVDLHPSSLHVHICEVGQRSSETVDQKVSNCP